MSFLSDIAVLAKAGYSPQDVKDLMQLNKATFDDGASPQTGKPSGGDVSKSQPAPKTEPDKPAPKTEPDKPAPKTEPDKPAEMAPKASAQPADETDYKALYEAEQEKLKALQNKNTQADISGNNATNVSDLLNVIRDYC